MDSYGKSTHTLFERVKIFIYKPCCETLVAIFSDKYVTISLDVRNEILYGKITTPTVPVVPISHRKLSSNNDKDSIKEEELLITTESTCKAKENSHSINTTNHGSRDENDDTNVPENKNKNKQEENNSTPPNKQEESNSTPPNKQGESNSAPPNKQEESNSTPPNKEGESNSAPFIKSDVANNEIKTEETLPKAKVVLSKNGEHHILDKALHEYSKHLKSALRGEEKIFYYKLVESDNEFIVEEGDKAWLNEQVELIYKIIDNDELNGILDENSKLAADQQERQKDNDDFESFLTKKDDPCPCKINISGSDHSAVADTIGSYRPTMEDKYILHKPCGDHYMYGVYDGHAGIGCSKALADKLSDYVKEQLDLWSSEIVYVDKKIKEEISMNKKTRDCNALTMAHVFLNESIKNASGSTAVSANLIDDDLYISNVGDSRAILISPDGTVTQLTEDAKSLTEMDDGTYKKNRHTDGIMARGGFVSYLVEPCSKASLKSDMTPLRVNSCLGVAKSIGDRQMFPGLHVLKGKSESVLKNFINTAFTLAVSARPDITLVKKPDNGWDGYKLLLCCDGLTDVASTNQIGAFVHQEANNGRPYTEIVNNIVAAGVNAGSTDNITVMLHDVNKMKD
ncbi:MAG: hypothetical protein KAG53_05425 [Endozoicomonadaceae bacterium]|nr:hypothetical protein [Endozoicomonadaceae bacterium]